MATMVGPITDPLALPPRKKNWFARHWVLSLLGGFALLSLLFASFVAVLLSVVEGSMKKSAAYTQAVARAQSDPHVIEKLGQPLQTGWFVSGNIQVTSTSGNANLSIPMSGSKSKGTLYVVAKKIAGTSRFDTMEVEVEGDRQRINLLPAALGTPVEQ